MSINMTEEERNAFQAGWRVGARVMFYEVKRLRDKCKYPEDVEMELDTWLTSKVVEKVDYESFKYVLNEYLDEMGELI